MKVSAVLSDPFTRDYQKEYPNAKAVFAGSAPKPLKGFPPGKIKLRLRPDAFAKAVVFQPGKGIVEFVIGDTGEHWVPLVQTGGNLRCES